ITGALQSAIFNNPRFSCIATDAKGVIQLFNVGAEQMLGYPAAEVVNKITPAHLHDPEEVIARAAALSLEYGTPIAPGFEALVFKASRGIEDVYELTKVRKDGSRLPAIVSVSALRDAQDVIIGYLLIGTENTALANAAEERNRFFALSLDMLCTLGFDGYYRNLNPAWEKTLGYTLAEIQATPFIDFVHPDDRRATLDVVDQLATGAPVIGFENRYRCKDGSYRFFLWNATRVIENQIIYGAARDITARKLAEEALLKAGALQNAIFNSPNFSSIATDANGVIQIFNVGAERMLGYAAAEVVNKITPANISDPQEMIAHANALSVELGTQIGPGFEALVFKASRGIEDIYELTYIRKDGSRFPAVVSVTALRNAEDQIIGYLLIGTDNTARRQAVQERQRLEEALEQIRQDQMRFKDEFLSHVSHELRSPLTAIKQFTTILLGGLAGDLNKEQREYQQIVLKNIRQLQAMIDDLLEVTRLETGKLTVEPERVSVMIAVTDTFNTLKGSARAKGVSLSYDLPPNLPSVHADPTRLRQILIILLDNAIKFTPEGGSVTIKALLLEQDARLLLLEVSDNGVGINPEITENIFERLYQVSERTEGSRKGLGLGLYICKELVMRQGGTIWAKRRPQKGSTFSFTLPVFSLTNSSVKAAPRFLEEPIRSPTIPLAVTS
ncbi:MAG: Aerobic respiration control sensor protein ArcB, partial [Gemmatimonadales bacterium]|nr:Aerobic respiration control sensor protein ArcB [Gemmatimonadales bacterium]